MRTGRPRYSFVSDFVAVVLDVDDVSLLEDVSDDVLVVVSLAAAGFSLEPSGEGALDLRA